MRQGLVEPVCAFGSRRTTPPSERTLARQETWSGSPKPVDSMLHFPGQRNEAPKISGTNPAQCDLPRPVFSRKSAAGAYPLQGIAYPAVRLLQRPRVIVGLTVCQSAQGHWNGTETQRFSHLRHDAGIAAGP